MSKKEVDFEWYVLNEEWLTSLCKFNDFPYTQGRVKPWNIFNNIHVHEGTLKLCEKYKRDKMTFDEFVEELRSIIQWQEWSRCEYEILVAPWPPGEKDKTQKIDCYQQVLPNIRILAEYVLRKYYPRIKLEVK